MKWSSPLHVAIPSRYPISPENTGHLGAYPWLTWMQHHCTQSVHEPWLEPFGWESRNQKSVQHALLHPLCHCCYRRNRWRVHLHRLVVRVNCLIAEPVAHDHWRLHLRRLMVRVHCLIAESVAIRMVTHITDEAGGRRCAGLQLRWTLPLPLHLPFEFIPCLRHQHTHLLAIRPDWDKIATPWNDPFQATPHTRVCMDVIIMQHFNSCSCWVSIKTSTRERESALGCLQTKLFSSEFLCSKKTMYDPFVQWISGLMGRCLRLAHNCIGNCVTPRLIKSHLANTMAYITSKPVEKNQHHFIQHWGSDATKRQDGSLPTPNAIFIFVEVLIVAVASSLGSYTFWSSDIITTTATATATTTAPTWHKPPREVSYKCTFGVPDQGQTLEVWGGHPGNVNSMVKIHRIAILSGRFTDSIFHPTTRNRIIEILPDRN